MHDKCTYNVISNRSGFTLIEVLIALAIFSIGFMAIGALQTGALRAVSTSQDRTRAIQILDAHVEELKRIPLYAQDIWRHPGGPPQFVMSPQFVANASDPDFSVVDGEFTVSWWIDVPAPVSTPLPVDGDWYHIDDRWLGTGVLTVAENITATIVRTGQDPVDDAIQRIEFVKYWVTDN
jgi:prepilin-type N-terminal cleavage/methylation domain-containing protein